MTTTSSSVSTRPASLTVRDPLGAARRRGRTIRRILAHGVAAMACLRIVYWFGNGWLQPGLPVGDMGGTVAGLAHWRHILTSGQLLSTWSDAWFCGHSRALFNLNGGMELAYLPFLLIGDELAAVKFGSLAYLGLSAFSAFVLLRHILPPQENLWANDGWGRFPSA